MTIIVLRKVIINGQEIHHELQAVFEEMIHANFENDRGRSDIVRDQAKKLFDALPPYSKP